MQRVLGPEEIQRPMQRVENYVGQLVVGGARIEMIEVRVGKDLQRAALLLPADRQTRGVAGGVRVARGRAAGFLGATARRQDDREQAGGHRESATAQATRSRQLVTTEQEASARDATPLRRARGAGCCSRSQRAVPSPTIAYSTLRCRALDGRQGQVLIVDGAETSP